MKNTEDTFQIKISRFKHHSAPSQILFDISSLKSPSNLCSPTNLQNFESVPNQINIKKVEKIKRFMEKHKGSVNPILYKQNYSFNEKWQAVSKDLVSGGSNFTQITGKFKAINFIMFPFLIIHLWFISIFRVFKYQNNQWLFSLGLALQFIGIAYQLIIIAYQIDFKSGIYHQIIPLINKKKSLNISGNLYSIVYHAIALGSSNTLTDLDYLFLLLFDALLIFYKYQILQQIYSVIRIEVIGSRYKLLMNLFDLASNIFMMIHFFAVLLFLCTYYKPDHNWKTISPINQIDDWISYYIQSFYFACTTMLTVGFGDIRPTNILQICCILIVQLVGIMNNAYVISQIGANLLLMHEQRNILQKDIANAQKIIKSNELSPGLSNKMIDDLVNNQLVNQQLSIVEEEILLDKLSQQFKTQVKESSQMRVVKKNLFLISNFTRRFQCELSKKLIKIVYPPHSILPNHQGKERLYIITKGSVDIATEKKFNNRFFPQKIIKSYQINKSSSLNAIYGYASLFSGRPTRIKAIANNFAVCYYLEQQDILQCIQKFTDDFQRYFQVKHKLQLYRIPQKYQIPHITSNREHYIPNIYVLIRRQKINKKPNRRRRIIRSNRRVGKMIQNFQDQSIKSDNIAVSSGDSITATHLQQQSHKRQGTIIIPFIQSPLITKPRNQRWAINNQPSKKYEQLRKLRLQQKQNEELQLCVFRQSLKQYKNYFPKGNLTSIASKYNKNKKGFEQNQTLTMNSTRLDELKWKRLRSLGK